MLAVLALVLLAVSAAAEHSAQLAFSVKAGGAIWGTPIFHNGKILFASYDRKVYAIDQKTGATVWTATADNSIRAGLSACAQSNNVVEATLSGAIIMRDLNTGNVIWKHQRKSFTWTFTPVCVNDFTIVPMRNDDLVVLSNVDGKELAVLQQSSGVWSAPLIMQNNSRGSDLQVIVAVTADASVISNVFSKGSFDASSRWKYDVVPHATHYKQKLHAWIFGSPCACLFDGSPVVVIGGNDRVVRAIDASTGKERWTARVGGKVSSAPIAIPSPNPAVTFPVVATESGELVCLGITGSIRWQVSLRQTIGSIVGPSAIGSIVVVGGMRGLVVGLDGNSGQQLFRLEIPTCNVRSSPGLKRDGSVLVIAVGCDDGRLQTLKVDGLYDAASMTVAAAEFPRPSVLRDINRALTHDAAPYRPTGTMVTATPIIITGFLCAVSGLALLWKRSHLRKTKS